MSEPSRGEGLDAPVLQSGDAQAMIDVLRQEGADQFDPVRMHYIEALARRASAHQGSVQRILNGKLAHAVTALRQRLALAQCGACKTVLTPDTDQRPETLGELVRRLAQHAAQGVDAHLDAHTPARAELKSVRYFRSTWSRLSAQRQVKQALGQAPKNAGPINSHLVALRSLALMRDIAPDYLSRFMSYVDTLLYLDQGDKGTAPRARIGTQGESGQTTKPSRARSRERAAENKASP